MIPCARQGYRPCAATPRIYYAPAHRNGAHCLALNSGKILHRGSRDCLQHFLLASAQEEACNASASVCLIRIPPDACATWNMPPYNRPLGIPIDSNNPAYTSVSPPPPAHGYICICLLSSYITRTRRHNQYRKAAQNNNLPSTSIRHP